MDLRIDHVTVAGRELDRLVDAFTEAGFPVEYGGRHSNGVTHMAIVGFRDGSYLELISTLEPDADSPWWHDPIHGDGGPCAWAIEVEDVAGVSDDLRDRGIRVDGPSGYERTREDGTRVAWDLTYLGGGDPGATLPFLISDRTPRERRVRPTGDLGSSPIVGVDTVVLGVADLDAAVERFETAFELSDPERGESAKLDAATATYSHDPVVLAEPKGEGWLADRLDAFGPRPIAYLLGYEDGTPEFADLRTGSIGDRPVEWAPVTHPVGRRYLGFVEVDS